MDDNLLEPHNLEQERRSIGMLAPGQPGLDRDKALVLIKEVQRLQVSDRRFRELANEMGRALARLDDLRGRGNNVATESA
jgi:hypothetical protein